MFPDGAALFTFLLFLKQNTKFIITKIKNAASIPPVKFHVEL